VIALLRGDAAIADKERQRLNGEVDALKRQRYIWADKVATGGVPDDIGRERQAQLSRQIVKTTAELLALSDGSEDIEQTLSRALDLVATCVDGYARASDTQRRRWNQTFFEKVKLDTRGAVPVLSPLFAALRPQGDSGVGDKGALTAGGEEETSPVTAFFPDDVSNKTRLVGTEGLEPSLEAF
jgi:hypothetical protein